MLVVGEHTIQPIIVLVIKKKCSYVMISLCEYQASAYTRSHHRQEMMVDQMFLSGHRKS